MNREQTKTLLKLAAEVFPDKFEPTKGRLDVWHLVLEPFEAESATAALLHHFRTSRFPPVPADVAQFVMQRGREKSIHPAPPPGLRYAVDYIEGNDS